MYQVKDNIELRDIIEDGKIPLETLDTSLITDMKGLFKGVKKIFGDISCWNVSNVTDMSGMFYDCNFFNQDISKWDVSKVETMFSMFYRTNFDQDISSWDILSVKDTSMMFYRSKFNKNLGAWDLDNKDDIFDMFYDSPYSFIEYNKDRENYLKVIVEKKEKDDKIANEIYLENEKNRLNNNLNQNVDLTTIEMEF